MYKMSESIYIKEYHNEEDNSNISNVNKGFYIKPSKVTGRDSIKGFLLTSQDNNGKVVFTDPDGFLEMDDLVDVDLEYNPSEGDFLVFHNGKWTNSSLKKAKEREQDLKVYTISFNRTLIDTREGILNITNLDLPPQSKQSINIKSKINGIPILSIINYEGNAIPVVFTSTTSEGINIVLNNASTINKLKGNINIVYRLI